MINQLAELQKHIKKCPLGWHKGNLVQGSWTTTTDIIEWLDKLKTLAEEETKSCQCVNVNTMSGHHLSCIEHWKILSGQLHTENVRLRGELQKASFKVEAVSYKVCNKPTEGHVKGKCSLEAGHSRSCWFPNMWNDM